MSLNSAERVSYQMGCSSCGKATEKPVAWLVAFDHLPCVTPGCGHLIDLKAAENAALIQKLSDQCADLDTFLAKRD